MSTVAAVEKRIRAVEGFAVRFLYSTPGPHPGKDVRGDRTNVPTYTYRRAAKDTDTVAAWVHGRFARQYPGFSVEVLDGSGHAVHGQTRLATVRGSYR